MSLYVVFRDFALGFRACDLVIGVVATTRAWHDVAASFRALSCFGCYK